MKKINTLFLSLLLLAGCAKIVAPVGGPRDVTPPVVVKETPLNNTTNFDSKSIKITFNEYVTLNNPIENIIFSPPLINPATYTLQGKSVVIKWKDTLLPNTTYSIIFADAFKDFTEGNILPLHQYSFSTGNTIDTLTLKGEINNAITTLPEKGIFVFLYDQNQDSLPLLVRPTYLTKSKTDGSFLFQNIKAGSYKIFALKDINANLIFDLPNEGIAFMDQLVIPDTLTGYPLSFFLEEDKTQQLLNPINPQKGHYRIPLKKSCSSEKSVKTTFLYPQNMEYYLDLNDTKDTLTYYFYQDFEDSVVVQIALPEWNIKDTLTLFPHKSTIKTARNRNQPDPKLGITVSNAGELYQKVALNFSFPIKPNSNIETIIIKEGKTTNDTLLERFSINGPFLRSFVIPYTFEPKATYTLIFKDSLFWGHNGATNDSLLVTFTTKTERDYGSLSMLYTIPEGTTNYIFTLLDGSNRVVQENTLGKTETILYDHLPPGNYKIKVIYDYNGNGKWDTGNYLNKQQPEKIIFFEKPVTIRGFWDLEETFEIK